MWVILRGPAGLLWRLDELTYTKPLEQQAPCKMLAIIIDKSLYPELFHFLEALKVDISPIWPNSVIEAQRQEAVCVCSQTQNVAKTTSQNIGLPTAVTRSTSARSCNHSLLSVLSNSASWIGGNVFVTFISWWAWATFHMCQCVFFSSVRWPVHELCLFFGCSICLVGYLSEE